MNETLPIKLEDSAIDAVIGNARTMMTDQGIAVSAAAKEIGIGYSTLHAFLKGSYSGDNAATAEKIGKWMAGRARRAEAQRGMPASPGFVMTETSKSFINAMEHAQMMPDLVVIGAGAGVGKTFAIRQYAATHANVFWMTAEPCISSMRAVLHALADALGIPEKMSAQRMSRAITMKLRGSGGLLVIDEAQHLRSVAIDQLRTFHDLAGVGVALAGNEAVYTGIEGNSRRPEFAQLYSRVGLRTVRPKPLTADIDMMLDAWRVTGEEQRKLAKAVARKPGALRGLDKTLRIAVMLAMAEGTGEPTPEHIQAAWSRISAETAGAVA